MLWLLRMNLTFAAGVEGPLDAATLRGALDAVQRRHPLLRASVVEERGGPAFVVAPATSPGPPIPLEVADAPAGSWTDWVESAESDLDRRFAAGEGPLARARLLRHGDGPGPERATLLVTVSHALADARAMGYLFRDLLEAAARLRATGRADLDEKPLPPTIEEILVRPLRLTEKLRGILRIGRTAGETRNPGPSRLPSAPAAVHGSPSTRILPLVVDPEGTAALAARAREEGTTLHGALAAAHLLALAAECSRTGEAVRLYLACPVNVAARVPSPVTDDVVLFASGVDAAPRVTPGEPLWPLARAVRRQLLEVGDPRERLLPSVLATGLAARMGPFLPADGRGRERLVAMAAKGPQITLVTNIGVLDIPAVLGPFRPRSFSFVVDNPVAPVMSSVATLGGTLTWCFATQRREVDDERAGRIARAAERLLRGALDRSAIRAEG